MKRGNPGLDRKGPSGLIISEPYVTWDRKGPPGPSPLAQDPESTGLALLSVTQIVQGPRITSHVSAEHAQKSIGKEPSAFTPGPGHRAMNEFSVGELFR